MYDMDQYPEDRLGGAGAGGVRGGPGRYDYSSEWYDEETMPPQQQHVACRWRI